MTNINAHRAMIAAYQLWDMDAPSRDTMQEAEEHAFRGGYLAACRDIAWKLGMDYEAVIAAVGSLPAGNPASPSPQKRKNADA